MSVYVCIIRNYFLLLLFQFFFLYIRKFFIRVIMDYLWGPFPLSAVGQSDQGH